MKRFLCCFICLAVLCFCIGCHSKNNDFPLRSGNYYAVGKIMISFFINNLKKSQ